MRGRRALCGFWDFANPEDASTCVINRAQTTVSTPGQPTGSSSPGVPRGSHSSPVSSAPPSQRLAWLQSHSHEVRTQNRGSILPPLRPVGCRVFSAADSAITSQLLSTHPGTGEPVDERALQQKMPGLTSVGCPFLPGHATRQQFLSPLQ